jgi:hypothetical protein
MFAPIADFACQDCAETGLGLSHLKSYWTFSAMTRRHVFDHALAQRADGLVDRGDGSFITGVTNPT